MGEPLPDITAPVTEMTLQDLARRYRGATPESLVAVLCPLLIPIESINPEVHRLPGQTHWRASFTVPITSENEEVLQRGCTGKFVPRAYVEGQDRWREICKGRIVELDTAGVVACGEIYTGSTRRALDAAVQELTTDDFLEIDQYGAAAKVLSGLAEYFLVEAAKSEGFKVYRMPEDMARHLGRYANFDFIFEKEGVRKKVEAKSLWGTNTAYARLIHSRSTRRPSGPEASWTEDQRQNYYPTSSCKFATQDIFAVSLFLRTGNIQDFAFARSVPQGEYPHGLARSSGHPEHVHQNPECEIGNGSWFASIEEVWNLD